MKFIITFIICFCAHTASDDFAFNSGNSSDMKFSHFFKDPPELILYKKAKDIFKNTDLSAEEISEGVKALEDAVELEHNPSRTLLGMILLTKISGVEDFSRGMELLTSAKESGDPNALLFFAKAYAKGHYGLEQHSDRALERLIEIMSGGRYTPGILYEIGLIHYYGLDALPPDIEAGKLFLMESAEKGNAKASELLESIRQEEEFYI